MSGGLLSLKWNNHQSTFLHVLSSLCLNDTLSDVTLACEGEFYAAHKLVLATCSEYFEKIFEKIEGKHSVIVLKDVKAEELEALLNYMYEGEVNVLQDNLSGLIKAAEYLKVKGLSDSDENPEIFSKQFMKKNKLPAKTSSSKEASLSPPVKRRRQNTESSETPISDVVTEPNLNIDRNSIESNHSNAEVHDSEREVEEFSKRDNQVYDIENIKEEVDIDLRNEVFNFPDESAHFLNNQEENIPQASSISLPSVSSQPCLEGNSCNPFIKDEGSSSSNLWESGGELSNLNSTNMIGHFSSESELQKMPDSEHMTITPDDLGPLMSEEDEDNNPNGTFKCPFCPFRTFQKNIHDTHLRRHSSNKTFFCQFCSYSCLTKSNLKCHIRKHTGEKPFGCPHCNYRSAQSSNIKIHVKRMHKNAPPLPEPKSEPEM